MPQPTAALQSDDPRHQFHELVVAEVVQETADACSFVFDVPPDLDGLFAYRPGQFLTFLVPWEDFEIRRCYSLSSTPGWDAKPKVTVKRVEDGRMSNWMNDHLKPGARIRVMPPAGQFVLHDADRPLFLFGGGSGITPVISLLKSGLAETGRRIRMVYANRDAQSVIFRDELDELARRHEDRFELVHHLDSEAGFLGESRLRELVADWLDADFYVCGPTPFMDAIEKLLHQVDLRGALHIERFVSAVDPDHAVAAPAGPAVGDVPETIFVHLDGARHEVPYREGETLLQAGVRAGLDMPFSCQDGYCSCCLAKLKRGEVFMPTHDALSQSEIDDGWILCCQARPTTPECEVEYED